MVPWLCSITKAKVHRKPARCNPKKDVTAKPLEISTKSEEPLGRKLSAFHLTLNHYALENVFQSAKVFENGGPYLDLLNVAPREAKHDERLKNLET